jgi:SOS-response transcriptional repressor LexA
MTLTRPRRPSLTKQQLAIFRAIQSHIADHQISPTMAEIAKAFGLATPTVHAHIHCIARKGYVTVTAGVARGISLVDDPADQAAEETRELLERSLKAARVLRTILTNAGLTDASEIAQMLVNDLEAHTTGVKE